MTSNRRQAPPRNTPPAPAANGGGGTATAPGTQRRSRRRITIPLTISVAQLAGLLGVSPIDVIKQLMRNNVMASINQVVDFEAAARVAMDLGFELIRPKESTSPGSLRPGQEDEDPSQLVERPPVVTVLGHVDHGKTTLLDAIRHTNVTATEVGGITQHIGAYQIEYNGKRITFVDTPGHEAFTAMRARGAQVTDIAVLVVAADDGVMPQTVEAISHARAAGVPTIVAINKIDRPNADLERVKRQLAEQGLLIEEWGGDVIAIPTSATTGEGLDNLLENLLVVAEVEELKANPNRQARGVVIEAQMDRSKGPLATVLIQNGTLRVGEHIVVGEVRGRVKAMVPPAGRRIKTAGPSVPVEILGLMELPQAGDILASVPDERSARQLVEEYKRHRSERGRGPTLEEVYSRIRAGEVKELNLIVKTDVQGTIDAITYALERLATEHAMVNLLHASSGSITESDVLLATASQAIIIAFSTRVEPGAHHLAEQEHVEIRHYDIIYQLIEDVEKALQGLLEPTLKDVVDGRAEVRAVFALGRRGNVAGVYVLEGRFLRSSHARVLRGGQVIHDGPIASLKRFKDDVRELATGYEGGVGLDGFGDFQEQDILEVHHQERSTTPPH